MPPQRKQSGMTLVELMIVVVVIAIMAGAFAPSVRRTVLEQRSGAAAREFVRLVRDARLRTMTLRRAHMVTVDPPSSTVRLLPGTNNSCMMSDWAAINAACTSNAAGRANGSVCTQVKFDEAPWSVPLSATLKLKELPVSGGALDTSRRLCFAPNGSLYQAAGGFTSGAALSDLNTVNGGFLYELQMERPGQDASESGLVPRQILIPLNGMARVLR